MSHIKNWCSADIVQQHTKHTGQTYNNDHYDPLTDFAVYTLNGKSGYDIIGQPSSFESRSVEQ